MKVFVVLFLVNLIYFSGLSQNKLELTTTSFEALDSLRSNKAKKIILFTNANWCKFCKEMEASTLKDSSLISRINQNFYFLNFDVESKHVIHFENKLFDFMPTGSNTGYHEFTVYLAKISKQDGVPGIYLFNEQLVLQKAAIGFLNVLELQEFISQ